MVNVALSGRATQSDLLKGEWAAFSHASNAIDGNQDSFFYHGSCSHTEGDNPWWRVDLLQVYTITSVTITNRGDCCGERISGARILIGKHLKNNGINNPQSVSVIGSMAAGETKTFRCPQPMIGRYVTVYLPKREYLHLCEVEMNVLFPAPC
ncbi:fucolectin-7-like [Anguilla anguilla]|uniref:fucolectin-7-like n=1 Tax=Anguilla anguilla TaxID=7936 RepID=UPI0015AB708E|nr:fucolectin-7-like [Anguilla anguilla]